MKNLFPASIFTMLLLVPICFTLSCTKLNIIRATGAVEPKVFTETFPFKLEQNVIVVEVNIAGKAMEFILDTGGFNLVDKKVADELGLVAKTSLSITDSQAQEREVPLLKLEQMEIAGIDFLETGTGIVDFSGLNDISCLQLEGMIGANLMQNAVWQIDYQQQEITIANDQSAFTIPTDSHRIPFYTETFKSPQIDVWIDGQLEKNVEIDLGSTQGISLAKSTLDKLSLTQVGMGEGHFSAGLYGYGNAEQSHFSKSVNVRLGELELNAPLVRFKPQGTSTIGNEFLKDYRVILDWTTAEVILIPVQIAPVATLENYGFRPIFNEGKALVGFLYDNSSAAQVGLKITDEIIAINGINFQNIDRIAWCEQLAIFKRLDDAKITIQVKRADERLTFELEKRHLL